MGYLNFDMEQRMRGKSEDMVGNYCSVVDDHIVSHLNGEPSPFASYDPHSKSPQETLNDVGSGMHSMNVTAPVLFGEEETSFSFQSDQMSVMQECSASSRGTTTYSKQSEKNFTSNIFSSAAPNLDEISVSDVNNDPVFPLDQILQVDELVDQDWANIENYKDLDMIFSTSPIIEQLRSVDNMLWASSTSDIVRSSSGTLKLGSHSASRKLGIINAVRNQNSANTNSLSEDCLLTIDLGKDHSFDRQTRSSVNDAENRTESEEKINEKFKGLEWPFSAEEKINGQLSEVPDSQSNWHNIHPHGVPMDYNFPFCQTQLAQLDSNLGAANAYVVRNHIKKLPSGHVGEYDVGNAKMDLLGCAMETPTISEASLIASTLYNDDLLEVVHFQQLQDVLCQFNHNAKQCIRDGLHRMARRTEQKNCFMNSCDDNDIELPEAGTNLIDRCVALLLFQNSSRPDSSAACVATLNEFQIP